MIFLSLRQISSSALAPPPSPAYLLYPGLPSAPFPSQTISFSMSSTLAYIVDRLYVPPQTVCPVSLSLTRPALPPLSLNASCIPLFLPIDHFCLVASNHRSTLLLPAHKSTLHFRLKRVFSLHSHLSPYHMTFPLGTYFHSHPFLNDDYPRRISLPVLS